jgi:hypothetical protein
MLRIAHITLLILITLTLAFCGACGASVSAPARLTATPVYADVDINAYEVAQGGTGDCWLLSTLMAVAEYDATIVRHMFTLDGEGRVMVTIHDTNGRPVTEFVAQPSMGDQNYARALNPNSFNWAAAIEIAAQHNGYAALIANGSNPSEALILLGITSGTTVYLGGPYTDIMLNSGATIACTGSSDSDVMYATHCYMVAGSDDSSVTIVNPWQKGAVDTSTSYEDVSIDAFNAAVIGVWSVVSHGAQ